MSSSSEIWRSILIGKQGLACVLHRISFVPSGTGTGRALGLNVGRMAFVLLLVAGIGDSVRADQPLTMSIDRFGGALVTRPTATPYPRLVAEFEPTRALLFGVADWQPHHREILIEIANKTAGHVNVMVMCNDTWQIKDTTEWLLESGDEFPHVYFHEVTLDTVWLRDFGPIFAQTSSPTSPGSTSVLDFFYEGTRPRDDSLPARWAQRTGARLVEVPWTIQGGNLIANGRGLALTTHRIFEDNFIRFPSPGPAMDVEVERRKIVADALTKFCNLSQLVVLEPLQSESTKHVDMFASFLSPTDVLVAQLDPGRDPINAQILDRNAQRLRRIRVGDVPLRVHRIAIPTRQGESWSTYTNAIIADDLVLMPVFDTDPPSMVRAAKASYERLLPNHTVKTIDMSSMKQLQGELHCLSLHVPDFAPMPAPVYPFANAVRAYFPGRAETEQAPGDSRDRWAE